ncbi:MAG TPA: DUF5696 domain-containing protein [Bacillota bacterium]|nr:DUF5696 domain-containing protein [Bacillota bacterium]
MQVKILENRRMLRFGLIATLSLISFVTVWAAGDGWNSVANRGNLSLSVDYSTGACKVSDNRNNNEWSSLLPIVPELNDYWKNTYRSAFIIRYLEDDTVKTLYTGQSDCKISIARMPNGVRCRFTFKEPKLSFAAEYTLGPQNEMVVNIPYKKIQDPKRGLLDIRVLPYLGHIPVTSRGYVVLPDGCGGIIRSGHLKSISYNGARLYGERFYWSVERDRNNPYGSNQRYINFYDYSNPNTIALNLPIFGSVQDNAGVMGIITHGSEQAQIGPEITPGDFVLSVSARLLIRELAYDMFTRAHTSPVFDRTDRAITYHFLAGKEASYSGMALYYRKKLFSSARHRPLDSTPRLRIFFGVERKYRDTRELLKLTTFHDAEKILTDLHRSGVRNLQVVLVGWSKRGYLGDEPVHFPPDHRFGGWSGLKRLIRTSKALGYPIGLAFDNTYAWKKGSGFHRAETVKDVQNIAVELGPKTEEYLRCPQPAWKHFFKDDFPRINKLGINGTILISDYDQGLITCMDSNHLVGGTQAIRIAKSSLKRLHKVNALGVNGAVEYAYKLSDSVWDLPSSASSICDQPVPLTPIVLHGIVGYSFEPINLRRDSRRELLRMIEYGGIPNALLTRKTVEDLSEARFNLLFSGRYHDWRQSFIQEYRLFQNRLNKLQRLTIIGHEKLAQGVYLTRYERNVEILVNYSPRNYTFNGITVKSLNYHIYGEEALR